MFQTYLLKSSISLDKLNNSNKWLKPIEINSAGVGYQTSPASPWGNYWRHYYR